VVVGSFGFPESVLLAELYAQVLERNDVPVVRQLGLGPREFVEPALQQGALDLVPEYAGSALVFVSLGAVSPSSHPVATHLALASALDPLGLVALDSAPAQDANAVAIRGETAAEHQLSTVSDLGPLASGMTFGGPPECPTRPLCLRGLEQLYGLRFGGFEPLDAGGPITRGYLSQSLVDAALLFTTDPEVDHFGFVLLEDDRGLQPAENVTPVVRRETLERFPQVETLLRDVSAALTTEVLTDLNRQIAEGSTPAEVAKAWLAARGLAP
jgi:osmoprotectant transport system substrate-binding protein